MHAPDLREYRPRSEREAEWFRLLPRQLAWAREHSPAYRRLLSDIDPASVTSWEALARIPLTRISHLLAEQMAEPPFGGYATVAAGAAGRVFASPGPIFEPQGELADPWRMGRACRAAGFRPGWLVHNSFAYHLTPGGFMLDLGCRASGCAVFPAGPGQTELQVNAMRALQPHAYVGTPSFLHILLQRAQELGVLLPRLRRALVSGEALTPDLRTAFEAAGLEAFQCYATADLGLIAYEGVPGGGLVCDEDVLVEIVRPGTGEPVPDGEVGEVVVTTFHPAYPLVRFATGDLSAFAGEPSPCGRTGRVLKGWLGRADQTVKVRGLFVHPAQVHGVAARFAGLGRVRLVVGRHDLQDSLRLLVETPEPALAPAVADMFRELAQLRAEVECVAPGSLPNDGRVIEDRRPH